MLVTFKTIDFIVGIFNYINMETLCRLNTWNLTEFKYKLQGSYEVKRFAGYSGIIIAVSGN